MRIGQNEIKPSSVAALFGLMSVLLVPLIPAYGATGDVLATFTPVADNGRALAFDGGTTLFATYASSASSASILHKYTTTGVPIGIALIHTAAGALVPCGALSWDGTQLWCGTYDGNGNIYTVNTLTGLATLQFNGISPSSPSTSCYDQPPGAIDGVAFDAGTLFFGDDAATKVFHDTTAGGSLGSFSAPYFTTSGITYSCKSGIASVLSDPNNLWMAVYQQNPNPDFTFATGRIALFTTSGAYTGISFITGQLKEGIAFDAVTFAPKCAVWALTNGLPAPGVINAYEVPCQSPPTGPPVGGKIIPADTTALFVAGIFTNAFWMVPTLGGIGGAIITLSKVRKNHSEPSLVPKKEEK